MRIKLNSELTFVERGRVDLKGKTDPHAKKRGWRCYSKCWGKIAYALGLAIKAECKVGGEIKVWYINAKSFAKRCIDDTFFKGTRVKKFITKVKKQIKIVNLDAPKKFLSEKAIKDELNLLKQKLNLMLSHSSIDPVQQMNQKIYYDQICFQLCLGTYPDIQALHHDLKEAMNTWSNKLNVSDWNLHSFSETIFTPILEPLKRPPREQAPLEQAPFIDHNPQDIQNPPSNFDTICKEIKGNLVKALEKQFPSEAESDLRKANLEYFDNICGIVKGLYPTVFECIENIRYAMLHNEEQYGDKKNAWVLDQFFIERDYTISSKNIPVESSGNISKEGDKDLFKETSFNYFSNSILRYNFSDVEILFALSTYKNWWNSLKQRPSVNDTVAEEERILSQIRFVEDREKLEFAKSHSNYFSFFNSVVVENYQYDFRKLALRIFCLTNDFNQFKSKLLEELKHHTLFIGENKLFSLIENYKPEPDGSNEPKASNEPKEASTHHDDGEEALRKFKLL